MSIKIKKLKAKIKSLKAKFKSEKVFAHSESESANSWHSEYVNSITKINELSNKLERLEEIHKSAMTMWKNEGTSEEQDLLVIKQNKLLERALERLELVSDDSESIHFVESCQPIVNDIRKHLNVE